MAKSTVDKVKKSVTDKLADIKAAKLQIDQYDPWVTSPKAYLKVYERTEFATGDLNTVYQLHLPVPNAGIQLLTDFNQSLSKDKEEAVTDNKTVDKGGDNSNDVDTSLDKSTLPYDDTTLVYANKVTPDFIHKVIGIGKELGINPNFIMAAINHETGGTFKNSTQNSIGATGLLQFLPSIIGGNWNKTKWKTTDSLKNASDLEGLDVVHDYLAPFKNKIKSFSDFYFAIFWPAGINVPADTVYAIKNLDSYAYSKGLSGSAELIASQNKGFDLNKDKQITASEVRKYVIKYTKKSIPSKYWSQFSGTLK